MNGLMPGHSQGFIGVYSNNNPRVLVLELLSEAFNTGDCCSGFTDQIRGKDRCLLRGNLGKYVSNSLIQCGSVWLKLRVVVHLEMGGLNSLTTNLGEEFP